ncbi:hypothetical protein B0I35DRAFT_37772 [Stachybotrys elegans]|uniref:rRNA-processing protein EFG1 n=1 Tax=Stachybotrys elegans TaxID=80388 RepID=A0A8K0T2A2_9HYPO|nr:hypothetical protein B0I35DRAFT_37772 [Stachybotrys elegans]
MGSKRSFDNVDPEVSDNDSSDSQHADGDERASKRRKSGTNWKHKPSEGSYNHSKKRVRTIERLFKRNTDLPADVRNDLERELAALRTTVDDKSFQKHRSAMISKYHMVRFFDRRKAMRLIKQLRRKIEQTSDPADLEKLKSELHVAEVDEAYTLYHPHAEAYVSLYKNPKVESASEESTGEGSIAKAALKAERPPMWSVVEKTMEEGLRALVMLRERRFPDGATATAKYKTRRPAQNKPAADKAPLPKSDTTAEKQRSQPEPKQPVAAASAAGGKQPTPAAKQTLPNGKLPMNRRERRRLMREAMATKEASDDDEEGGFFEEF